MTAADSSSHFPDGVPPQAWAWPFTAEPEVAPTPTHSKCKDGGHCQGMPLGGMGAGGIVRNYQGGFGRWTLKTGALKHFNLPANMFAVRQCAQGGEARAVALHPGHPTAAPGKEPVRGNLGSWDWTYTGAAATYYSLFPKAWHHYPATEDLPVSMLCEQFSPILPDNYRESSLPLAVFAWHLENQHDRPVRVSLLFSFTNMAGWFRDFGDGKPSDCTGGGVNAPCHLPLDGGGELKGVLMGREPAGMPMREGDGQFCIAALQDERRRVSIRTAFNPRGPGREVWDPFAGNGRLDDDPASPLCVAGHELAGALCVEVELAPGERLSVPMALAWDLPIVEMGGGRRHLRRHTRFFGAEGTHAVEIAGEALRNWEQWSADIDQWHDEVTSDQSVPDWYYSMLFNECYLLVDGYTVWTDGTLEQPGEDPFFAIIECPDYPYYCTLDLWVYGSFVLLMHWPELEKNVIRRFAKLILQQDAHSRRSPHTGALFPAKVAGAAPHDFGEPKEDPSFVCNSYVHQDSNRWKDLNCQFVLALCRDVNWLDDDALLKDCWPAVKLALEYLARHDTDGDGLIENDGTPDQTMDNIPMTGPSAYCGGLWISAVNGAMKLAGRLQDHEFTRTWSTVATTGPAAFEDKLWDGEKYRFDTDGPFSKTIFVDALFGVWYGRICGLKDLLADERVRASLLLAYQRNFREFHDGAYGARNISGDARDSEEEGARSMFNTTGCQVEEILSGLNMSFAAQLLDRGCRQEAFEVLKALHDVIYRRFGLWFRTPAAWTAQGEFRAILNLRPLIIWAFEYQKSICEDGAKLPLKENNQ
ncbi:MAG: hypothetical protein KAI66_06935 [Lentisphaeria bacterium]|nr:hypothetical protein [Lentisphaeria bacterium]